MGSHVYGTIQQQQAILYDNSRPQDYSGSGNYDTSFADYNTPSRQTHSSSGQYQGSHYGSMNQSWSTAPSNGPQVTHTNTYNQDQIQPQGAYLMNQFDQHTPGGYNHSPSDKNLMSSMNYPPEPWSKGSRLASQGFASVGPKYPSEPMSPPSSDVSPEMMARSTSSNFMVVPGHQATYLSPTTLECECKAKFLGKKHKNNKSNFKRHLNSLETAAFACELCGSGFTREDNLRAHLRRKHS